MDYNKLAAELGVDADDIEDLIGEEGKRILTLGWDADRPGSYGAEHIVKWRGRYFFTSTDMDTEGPFDDLEEVLALDYFHTNGTPKPELYSEVLDFERLAAIARDIDEDRTQIININDRFYEWEGDSLRERNKSGD
ncbi:MAG: hypothetical protein JSS81_27360 [Acidobacteria bacterium]|nr:hypothetical protein [Acidobacteriota bacterium]